MIPKIIHYCWFGRKALPEIAHMCIESWRRNMPDYEIIEWNEDNFDINANQYIKGAYREKKYAFVSDYARLNILYNHGGIYFDTDVEVIKPLDEIIEKGAFMGCERNGGKDEVIAVNPGLGLACEASMPIYKELLDLYASLSFYKENGSLNLTTIVQITTDMLMSHGLQSIEGIQYVAGCCIYPSEYFCPKSGYLGQMFIADKSYTIHHFKGSWLPWHRKIERKIKIMIKILVGVNFYDKCKKILCR